MADGWGNVNEAWEEINPATAGGAVGGWGDTTANSVDNKPSHSNESRGNSNGFRRPTINKARMEWERKQLGVVRSPSFSSQSSQPQREGREQRDEPRVQQQQPFQQQDQGGGHGPKQRDEPRVPQQQPFQQQEQAGSHGPKQRDEPRVPQPFQQQDQAGSHGPKQRDESKAAVLFVSGLKAVKHPLTKDILETIVNQHAQVQGRRSYEEFVSDGIFVPGKDIAYFHLNTGEAAQRAQESLNEFRLFEKEINAEIAPHKLAEFYKKSEGEANGTGHQQKEDTAANQQEQKKDSGGGPDQWARSTSSNNWEQGQNNGWEKRKDRVAATNQLEQKKDNSGPDQWGRAGNNNSEQSQNDGWANRRGGSQNIGAARGGRMGHDGSSGGNRRSPSNHFESNRGGGGRFNHNEGATTNGIGLLTSSNTFGSSRGGGFNGGGGRGGAAGNAIRHSAENFEPNRGGGHESRPPAGNAFGRGGGRGGRANDNHHQPDRTRDMHQNRVDAAFPAASDGAAHGFSRGGGTHFAPFNGRGGSRCAGNSAPFGGGKNEENKGSQWGQPPAEFNGDNEQQGRGSSVEEFPPSKVISINEVHIDASRQCVVQAVMDKGLKLLDLFMGANRPSRSTGPPTQFALAEFPTLEEAERAIKLLKDVTIRGKKVMVNYSRRETIGVDTNAKREAKQRRRYGNENASTRSGDADGANANDNNPGHHPSSNGASPETPAEGRANGPSPAAVEEIHQKEVVGGELNMAAEANEEPAQEAKDGAEEADGWGPTCGVGESAPDNEEKAEAKQVDENGALEGEKNLAQMNEDKEEEGEHQKEEEPAKSPTVVKSPTPKPASPVVNPETPEKQQEQSSPVKSPQAETIEAKEKSPGPKVAPSPKEEQLEQANDEEEEAENGKTGPPPTVQEEGGGHDTCASDQAEDCSNNEAEETGGRVEGNENGEPSSEQQQDDFPPVY